MGSKTARRQKRLGRDVKRVKRQARVSKMTARLDIEKPGKVCKKKDKGQ
jgi:hypothetical protein